MSFDPITYEYAFSTSFAERVADPNTAFDPAVVDTHLAEVSGALTQLGQALKAVPRQTLPATGHPGEVTWVISGSLRFTSYVSLGATTWHPLHTIDMNAHTISGPGLTTDTNSETEPVSPREGDTWWKPSEQVTRERRDGAWVRPDAATQLRLTSAEAEIDALDGKVDSEVAAMTALVSGSRQRNMVADLLPVDATATSVAPVSNDLGSKDLVAGTYRVRVEMLITAIGSAPSTNTRCIGTLSVKVGGADVAKPATYPATNDYRALCYPTDSKHQLTYCQTFITLASNATVDLGVAFYAEDSAGMTYVPAKVDISILRIDHETTD